MRAIFSLTLAALFATAFAGCVGDFQVRQTEPIRIQIDDDTGSDSRIGAAGCCDGDIQEERREFELEAPDDVDKVVVIVKVVNVESEGRDDSPAPTTTTTGNGTGNQTTSPAARNETAEKPCVVLVTVEDRSTGKKLAEQRVDASDSDATVNLDVDVRGNNNIVVITQAVEGVADVNVAAKRGTAGDSGGGTSPTNTTSPSPTNTTTPR